MLTADIRHDYVRTFIAEMRNSDRTVESGFEEMAREAAAAAPRWRRDRRQSADPQLRSALQGKNTL